MSRHDDISKAESQTERVNRTHFQYSTLTCWNNMLHIPFLVTLIKYHDQEQIGEEFILAYCFQIYRGGGGMAASGRHSDRSRKLRAHSFTCNHKTDRAS